MDLFVYGKVIAGHIDPIEKKPAVHYMPGSKIFSIATTGCNWLCSLMSGNIATGIMNGFCFKILI